MIWHDANRNRAIDLGETGIEGVTVSLTRVDEGGGESCSAVSRASGAFSFGDLPFGVYWVGVTDVDNRLAGYEPTTPSGPLTVVLSAEQSAVAVRFGHDLFLQPVPIYLPILR